MRPAAFEFIYKHNRSAVINQRRNRLFKGRRTAFALRAEFGSDGFPAAYRARSSVVKNQSFYAVFTYVRAESFPPTQVASQIIRKQHLPHCLNLFS